MHRTIGIELARVTESAALAAGRFMGRGDPGGAEAAAIDAMRRSFAGVDMDGSVLIGGWKAVCAKPFAVGERVGSGRGEQVSLAVDPLEGTRLVATGGQNALCVVVAAEAGGLLDVPGVYMEKIAVGPRARGVVDLASSPVRNLRLVANAVRSTIEDLTVVILDRPRHEDLIAQVRETGARIKLIPDGDMAEAISCAVEGSGVDVLMGTGGAPEGILSAAAIRCLGGDMQARLISRNEQDAAQLARHGLEGRTDVLRLEDMVPGEDIYFVATGVTDGDLLRGVRFHVGKSESETIVLRSRTGTVRRIRTVHNFSEASPL